MLVVALDSELERLLGSSGLLPSCLMLTGTAEMPFSNNSTTFYNLSVTLRKFCLCRGVPQPVNEQRL
jgi:hypothetical protein